MAEIPVRREEFKTGPDVVNRFIVEEGGVVVSKAILRRYNNQCRIPFGYLTFLDTDTDYKRQGFATRILQEIDSYLKDEGLLGVLENIIPDCLIYKKNGWQDSITNPGWMIYNKPLSASDKQIDEVINYSKREDIFGFIDD